MVLLDDQPKAIIPETEYHEEYKNESYLKEQSIIKKHCIPAGLPSKGKPEYESQEYESSNGVIVPHFRGITTDKFAYVPQPTLSKLQNFKPPSTTKVFILGPRMTEEDSYSHSVHCPMPQKLLGRATSTRPWMKDNLKPLTHGARYDLTSSYQADYCGVQTQPRKICLETISKLSSKDLAESYKECSFDRNPKCEAIKDEIQLWNYAHSLLFRTTYNTTYLPPSILGFNCHPTMYHPKKQ